jgi:hypothetical protein
MFGTVSPHLAFEKRAVFRQSLVQAAFEHLKKFKGADDLFKATEIALGGKIVVKAGIVPAASSGGSWTGGMVRQITVDPEKKQYVDAAKAGNKEFTVLDSIAGTILFELLNASADAELTQIANVKDISRIDYMVRLEFVEYLNTQKSIRYVAAARGNGWGAAMPSKWEVETFSTYINQLADYKDGIHLKHYGDAWNKANLLAWRMELKNPDDITNPEVVDLVNEGFLDESAINALRKLYK